MPPLRNLVCQVEWDSPNNLPLQEYKIAYRDGYVESYLAIPRNPTPFAIHLTSHGYIAPGLAIYVSINGEYQCNRNRHRLRIPAEGVAREDCEVDFRLRQKEHSRVDGTWKAPDISASEDEFAAPVGQYGGRIDVVVLRCYPSKPSGKTVSHNSASTINSGSSRRSSFIDEQEEPLMTSAMFDGAGDSPPPRGRRRPREDSRQRHRCEGDQKDPQTFRLGGCLFFSGARSPIRGHSKKTEPQSPVTLRLRGGAGSEGKSTKKRSPSPALSSRSYRLGSGELPSSIKTPKGSPDSHTLKNTWKPGLKKKSDNDTTGSYTPDKTWGTGGTAQAGNQWQEKGTWTWEPGSNQKNLSKPPESWERTTDPKDDQNTKDQTWNIDDAQVDTNWNNTNDNDHQTTDHWDNAGADDNGQQDGAWGAFEDTGNDEQNGDQNDNWNTTEDNDQSHQDGNLKETLDENDQKNDSGTGDDQNNAWSVTWEGGEGKTSEDRKPDTKQSPKVATKAGIPTHGVKARDTGGGVWRPPSIRTPAIKTPASKRAASKAPSVISIRAALNSPFRSWAPAKVPKTTISDEDLDKVAAIPGAWSPPLEKKEEKTRSESTKRRAAEFNVERAKAHVAESNAKSVEAGSHRSKPTTPLPTASLKNLAKSAAATAVPFTSRLFQTTRKRRSKSLEKDPIVVDAIRNEGRHDAIRPSSPMSYSHKTCAPHYMDSLADPYAHFVFHYREKALISKMCDVVIVETKEELRSRLAGLTKQELLDLLVEEQSAADEEADEKMTWKTSLDKAGYEPNLNAANDKLDEWGTNNADGGGGNGWGNQDSGGDGWGTSKDVTGGNGDNSSQVNYDSKNDQGGDSWGNDNNDNNDSGNNNDGGNWDNDNNSNNNNADGNVGWGNNDDNAEGNNSNGGGGGGEGW